MSMKMMKKATIGIFGAAALIGSVGAQAAVYEGGSALPAGTASSNVTFSGLSTLTQSFLSADCVVNLSGNAVEDPSTGDVTVTVTSGNVENTNFGCSAITLDFTPAWTATVPAGDLPFPPAGTTITDSFDDVQVTGPFGACSSASGNQEDGVQAMFTNGASVPNTDPSVFSFQTSVGNCSVSGQLEAVSGQDVDAY